MASPSPIPSSLAQRTEQWFQRARASLLGQVPCRPGCARCCIGPFPITVLDRERLQEGLAGSRSDRRERIQKQARIQVEAMERLFPRLGHSPSLDEWPDPEIDRLVNEFHQHPCPALSTDGLCELYEHRPLACRSMGIPTEEGGRTIGACEIQTFVPIVRLPGILRDDADRLAGQEGLELEAYRATRNLTGEEILLPYGFLPPDRLDRA